VIEHMFVMETTNKLNISSLPGSVLNATGTQLCESGNNVESFESTSSFDSEEDSDDSEMDLGGEEELSTEVSMVAGNGSLDFNAQKEAFEKEFIIKALKTFGGRINQTALHANIPKKTLLRKIEKYGIIAKDFSDT